MEISSLSPDCPKSPDLDLTVETDCDFPPIQKCGLYMSGSQKIVGEVQNIFSTTF